MEFFTLLCYLYSVICYLYSVQTPGWKYLIALPKI